MRQQIWFALGLNALALLGLAFLVWYQTVHLGERRDTSRGIAVRTMNNVAAIRSVVVGPEAPDASAGIE